MERGLPHVGVYAEVDLNLIDGSSIWVQSICQALSAVPARVTLLCRTRIAREVIVAELRKLAAIRLVDDAVAPDRPRLSPADAAAALVDLDRENRFDAVLLRGEESADAVLATEVFDGRIWLYHVPAADSVSDVEDEFLERRAGASSLILCQTPSIADHVRAAAPTHESKIVLLPPMIPARDPTDRPVAPRDPAHRLVYAGKVSPEYCFRELIEILGIWRDRNPRAELHVAGDKIHNPPTDPRFAAEARTALERTSGLIWHGALPRVEVGRLIGACDVAFSTRQTALSSSRELSTKILEYGAAGRPVLLNETGVHADLLGADYPLFADTVEQAVERLRQCEEEPEIWLEAARRCYDAAGEYEIGGAAALFARHLPSHGPLPREARRVLIAGHDMKFLGALPETLRELGAEVRYEKWANHVERDRDAASRQLEWAQTIFCEWCLGNAVFHSRHRRDDQDLVVRFHRMELETPLPGEVDLAAVDAMVFVADHVRDEACARYGWTPDGHFHVIPNAVDTDEMDRPKTPGSEYSIGMIGYVPRLKRLDLALDLIEHLRRSDPRFRLIVKGHPPTEFGWLWQETDQRSWFEAQEARIAQSQLLREGVSFEPFGDDIADYLRRVSWIASVSDIEGHPVGVAEAMAARCVPAILNRVGASRQYEPRWIGDSIETLGNRILKVAAGGMVSTEGENARSWAVERWSDAVVKARWEKLLMGRAPTAPVTLIAFGGTDLEPTPTDDFAMVRLPSGLSAAGAELRLAGDLGEASRAVVLAGGSDARAALELAGRLGAVATVLERPRIEPGTEAGLPTEEIFVHADPATDEWDGIRWILREAERGDVRARLFRSRPGHGEHPLALAVSRLCSRST